jgi:superfamily II DNA or RNA helicase
MSQDMSPKVDRTSSDMFAGTQSVAVPAEQKNQEKTKENVNNEEDFDYNQDHDISNKIKLRNVLQEPYENMIQKINTNDNIKLLFQAFCGIGKSRAMYKTIFDTNFNLNVFVFPSLGLIYQFMKDYISDTQYGFGIIKNDIFDYGYDISVICTLHDKNKNTITTDPSEISRILDSSNKKIICISYQSFHVLNSVLEQKNMKIDLAIFDEAHNSIGKKIHKNIYINPLYNHGIFFTATPKNNEYITMFDRDCQEESMCGERIANITYLDGLFHGHLNDFEIRAGIIKNGDDNMNTMNIYKTIVRNVLLSKNSRVLTYHSYSNSKKQQKGELEDEDEADEIEQMEMDEIESSINYKTNVKDFVNQKLFKKAFNEVLCEPDFMQYKGIYKKVTMKGVVANTKNRESIFKQFQNSPDNEIFVLSSCQVMKEGIDTKNANHVVFVDSKNSISAIIQNIGRMLRKNDRTIRPATLTIPCLIDYEKYRNMEGELSQDDYIRSAVAKFGDYNNIMNVLTAIQQDDEDYYQMCLVYPNKHFKDEIKRNVESNGFKFDEDSKTTDISTLCDIPKMEEESNEEYLNRVAVEKDGLVELHTNNMGEDNIKYFGEDFDLDIEKEIKERLYHNDEDNTFYKINEGDNECENEGKKKKSSRTKRYNKKIQFTYDDEFMVLWNVDNMDEFSKNMSNCVLKFKLSGSRYEFIWYEKLEKVKEFVVVNKRLPSAKKDKNDEEIKILGKWCSHQKTNYDSDIQHCKYIMKNPEIKKKWEEFMEEFPDLFTTPKQDWMINLHKVKEFVLENKRLPSNSTDKNNEEIKILGNWCNTQKKIMIVIFKSVNI